MIIISSAKRVSLPDNVYACGSFIFLPVGGGSNKWWVFKQGIFLFAIGYGDIPYYVSSLKNTADEYSIILRPHGTCFNFSDNVSLTVKFVGERHVLNNNLYHNTYIFTMTQACALVIPHKMKIEND